MKYDTVIVEMLSRIQALEEQVAELKNEQKKEAEKEINKVSTADIRTFIDGMINEAANSGKDSITLKALDIQYASFHSVEPDPTLACARAGAEQMRAFSPDVIIAFGGGSAMDAAKISLKRLGRLIFFCNFVL